MLDEIGVGEAWPDARLDGERVRTPDTRPRRRIMHLSKHCHHANGSVNVAVDLACEQAAAGHEVWFLSGGGSFVGLLERSGVRHVELPQDQKHPRTLARSALRLTRLVQKLRPDVVHAHMMGGAAIGWLATRLTSVPMVTTVHNSFDWHSTLMRLGDRVVAVSAAERDQLLRRRFSPQRTETIWNAPENSPRHAGLSQAGSVVLRRPCVLAICGLHRRKGVFDLLDACSQVFPDHPEWRLYIAGEGPDRERLEQQAASLGLADRVSFLGFIELPRTLYTQSDIFVLASYADPGSLTIGEARAAGCTIVATAVGGTTEMLEYGRAGHLFRPGAVDQLAERLRALIGDPQARAALAAQAREGAEVFDVARLVEDYQAVYERAIAERRRSSKPAR